MSKGAKALGANFLAKRKHMEVGTELYKQKVPLFLMDWMNSTVIFGAPYLAGCDPPLDQSTQVRLRFAFKAPWNMFKYVGM